jgi:hypothetical protein
MPKSKFTKKLIEAFNSDNYFCEVIGTNLTLESKWNKDYIVIKFDKSMDVEQCMGYMKSLKEKVIKRFFVTEDDADIAFNIKSFPFNLGTGQLLSSKNGMKYVAPVDEGTIFNLKCYLMSSLAKDIEGRLGKIFGVEYIDNLVGSAEFDHRHYLYCAYFGNKEVKNKFIELFWLNIKELGVPAKLFNIEGNYVYIKDIFKGNISLIDSMTQRNLWLMGRDLEVPSNDDKYVKVIKDRITDLIYAKSSILICNVLRAPYLDSKENSVLIPVVQDSKEIFRLLTRDEADNINKVFDYAVLNNVDECIPEKYLIELLEKENYKTGIYGINFYDKEISCCIMSKVIESSVINKNHELSIDPELHFRALSSELPQTQLDSPRPDSELSSLFPINSSKSTGADENVQGASAALPKSMDFPTDEAYTYGSGQPQTQLDSPRHSFEPSSLQRQ